ncbi:MAG: SsrA-binding protein SmpB [Chloroflexota bacterium]
MRESGIKVIAKNRQASFNYMLGDRYEAGLVLTGTEIKSIRNNKVDLKRSFARPEDGEMWVYELYISPYEQGNRENHEPERKRKLLLHRKEIAKIERELTDRGVTIVPTKLYLKDGRAKIEVAVARGKKNYDKRQALAKKDAQRTIERSLKERNR